MEDLSITQELALILLSEERELNPLLDDETPASMVAAGLLEMVQEGLLALPKAEKPKFWDDSSRLVLKGVAPEQRPYLQTMAEIIQSTKNQTMQELVYKFFTDFDDKTLKGYINSVLDSLQTKQLICPSESSGFLGIKKTVWKVDSATTERIIQNLRVNLLEEGSPERESTILAILLDKVKLLKRYFSEHESKQIKARINAFKQDPANAVLKEVIEILEGFYAIVISTIVTGNL